MTAYVLHLESATQYQRVDDVVSFVAADSSGSFGIEARHERLVAALGFGIARYRRADGSTTHVALPGGVAYFVEGELHVSTRRWIADSDHRHLLALLEGQLEREERAIATTRERLAELERSLTRRIWEVAKDGPRA